MSAFDGTNGPTLKVQFSLAGTWTNVPTTDLRSVDFTRGRTRPDQRVDAGSMTITLDNFSGDYDPDNASSPWQSGGVTTLRSDLKARLVATWSSTSYVLYTGFLETTSLDAGFDATTTMTFVDGIAILGRYTAPPLKKAAYSGETSATRVGRMLTYAKWPTGTSNRSLAGSVTLGATAQDSAIMDIIYECEDAEAGTFYVSRTNVATFVNLQGKFSRPTQLTFDDQRTADTVEYSAITTTPGAYQLVNAAIVNYAIKDKKGKKKSVQQKASVAKYGLKLVEVETKTLKDSNASNLATYLAKRNSTPKTLVESITFNGLALGALYPDFLETEILDMCIVKRKTVDGRSRTFELVIEGFNHKITPDSWSVTYNTSAVDRYQVPLT